MRHTPVLSHRSCSGLAALAVLLLSPRLAHATPDVSLLVSVDPVVPAAGQLVEIRVVATNVGTTDAGGLVVQDQLPPAVAVPAGMTHFASAGTYSPATGRWDVGRLAPGASASLTFPVTVVGDSQPACIVNVARATTPDDPNTGNDRASAAIRRTAADRCADLRLEQGWLSSEGCGTRARTVYYLPVYNDGPDDATSVIVDFTQSPEVAPGLRFTAAGCTDTRCVLPSLKAGAAITLEADSERYLATTDETASFAASVSSAETDFATENNQRNDVLVVFATPGCGEIGGDVGVPLSGCFIATAAFGSSLEPHVQALREFRDDVLSRSRFGRAFIDFYYRHSPPVAALIARHASLRVATRAVLMPVAFAVEHPGHAMLGSFCSMMLALGLTARRRGARHES